MEFINVIVAAVGSFAFGAVWYMTLSKPWMEAAGIPMGADGRPAGGQGPTPMVVGFVANILVAGMMRHVFAMGGIDTLAEGLLSGAGVGAFFITPWTAMNYAFGMRPVKLTVIDCGYAIVGCTIMGAILTLF